ncbi:MarR family winged helix-turn-helix transcriptional regulator [Plantactinospora sp. WMMB782]|uniref:MarR family winged helix-turn-helix transcriptional regulator n=1 Tax=Plantactinospora sp. WMMB782 TaxID=3404121 RepID=UPI003B94ED3F
MTGPAEGADIAAGDRHTAPLDADSGEELLVLWELVQTAHVASRAFRETFAAAGLGPTQFGVLACLADGDDLTKTQLAHALMVRPQSIDPLVESLLRAGLVTRDGPARRGQAAGISITPLGLDRLAVARPLVSRLNAPERLGLEVGEIASLVRHLRGIRDRLTRDGEFDDGL